MSVRARYNVLYYSEHQQVASISFYVGPARPGFFSESLLAGKTVDADMAIGALESEPFHAADENKILKILLF